MLNFDSWPHVFSSILLLLNDSGEFLLFYHEVLENVSHLITNLVKCTNYNSIFLSPVEVERLCYHCTKVTA